MYLKVSLTLKQMGHLVNRYEVIKIENSTEWDIKDVLTKSEVNRILDRRPPREVKVIIK